MVKKVWKNKIGRLVALLITALVGFFVVGLFLNQAKIASLEKKLADINIEKIKLANDPADYRVKQGEVFTDGGKVDKLKQPAKVKKVLAIAFLYQKTLEDPLFTAPDFKVGDLKKSIDEMGSVQKRFLDAKLVPKPMFPLKFLEELIKVQDKEQSLRVGGISESKIIDLLSEYQSAQKSYNEEIEDFTALYDDKVKAGPETRFVFLNTLSSGEVVKKDLKTINENAKALEAEIKSRENCLKSADCGDRGLIALDKVPRFEEVPLPKTVIDDVLLVSRYLHSVKRGPYEVATPCFGLPGKANSEAKKYPFYVIDSVDDLFQSNHKTIFLKQSNQVYFRRLNKDDPVDRELIDQGQTWNWFPETNTYSCLNLEYQPTLATMDYFVTEYKSPVLPELEKLNLNEADKKKIKAMIDFEDAFYKSKYITADNFENLKKVYLGAYESLVRNKLDYSQARVKGEILKRALLIDRKLANFDKIVNQNLLILKVTLVRDIEILKEGKIGLENFFPLFLTARSTYSLLYFPFSRSMWRLGDKPAYLENESVNLIGSEHEYMSLDQAKEKYSSTEINSWYHVFIDQIKEKTQ